MTTFASLTLLPSTQAVIDEMKFTTMTPVQAATIPLFLQNKDVCVEVMPPVLLMLCGVQLGIAMDLVNVPMHRPSQALERH